MQIIGTLFNFLRRACRFFCIAGGLGIASAANGFELEVNAFTTHDTLVNPTWTNVTFIESFDAPPIVVTLATTEGSDPATLRIRNISTTGFEVSVVKPSALTGTHIAMNAAYIAVDEGTHYLPDGTQLVAQRHSTSIFSGRSFGNNFDNVAFSTAFAATPATIASLQTMANESSNPPSTPSIPFLNVSMRNNDASAFNISIERAESNAGSVTATETIGVVAIANNTNSTFDDTLGNSVRLQAHITPNNIRGYDNGCYTNTWPASFASTPLSVASLNSRRSNNGGWFRRCSESATTLGLTVDEDTDRDAERAHNHESASMYGASSAFHANFGPNINLTKTVSVLSDPQHGTTNPYSIPGAIVAYVISSANTGSSSPNANSIVLTDTLPAELSLCVSALCAVGGPVVFDDSSSPVATGLSVGSITYSSDGGATFTHPATPDLEGFDSAIDTVRIQLTGVFAAISGAGTPSFEVRLTAKLE